MDDVKQLVINLGKKLDFDVETEVPASESAWVDVVWYDKSIKNEISRFKIWDVFGQEKEKAKVLTPDEFKTFVEEL